ncbi:sulfurtransferase [Mumia zhuanghuii]|uniref:Sulfurtransferase n=2 Tax=Mumia TaxID=1546255 RepID=A0ABW1QMN6_9ACTN|nr:MULTISPECIES: sulfurtransferase [Mumia]KAA1423372.1 sulfurtransferase [Mumia zhuanghuii]
MVSDPVITVAELADLRANGEVTVLDVRYVLGGAPGRDAYAAGHVPGASYADMDTELADPPGDGRRGRHPLPDPGRFAAAMRAHGVRREVPVVVYDAADGTSAARAWWLLTYHGHPDVRLLDGGYAAWVAAGQPTSTGAPSPEPGDFVADPGHLPVVDAEAAARVAREGVLLDARVAERYRGEVEPIDPVAGHVPGAVSAPTFDNVDGQGRWRSADELAARFAALGVSGGVEVAAYCGSGVTAAHEVLALRRAGVVAALYAGSWSEWVSDPGRPVATGVESV